MITAPKAFDPPSCAYLKREMRKPSVRPYLDLLRHVRERGVRKPTRAVLRSTGQNVHALSVFGYQARYDLARLPRRHDQKARVWTGRA